MWITYPHPLWITYAIMNSYIAGYIAIVVKCGYVDNLSTAIVDKSKWCENEVKWCENGVKKLST
jgi:hypothetical protein